MDSIDNGIGKKLEIQQNNQNYKQKIGLQLRYRCLYYFSLSKGSGLRQGKAMEGEHFAY